jgi:hypothetical protein
MEKVCENCGNTFDIINSRVESASYCSLDCKHQSSKERRIKYCDNCDEELELRPSEISNNNFCTRECYHEFRTKEKVTLTCNFCDEKFESLKSKASTRKTCSDKCKYNLREKKSTVTVNCDECGNSIKRKKHRADGKNYCDHRCYGKSKESTKLNWHKKAAHRKWSKKVKDNKNHCESCGGKENLQAHHIIPIEVAPEKRNNVSNGVALCAECHSNKHPDVPNKLFQNARVTD